MISASDPLSASVLVLNRHYLAVHIIGARRAFALLYRQLCEVIDVEDGVFANYDFEAWMELCILREEDQQPHEDWVRGVGFRLAVPRVVRLLTYERVPRRTVRFSRRNLFARDDHRCQYCGNIFPTSQLSLDHVLPRSRGGPTSWENVVCSCVRCNVRKGGRTPQEARMKLMKEPHRPAHSPLLALKLDNPKYETWKTFLGDENWVADVR